MYYINGINYLHIHNRCDKIIITPVESDQADTVVKQIANMVAIDSYIFIPYNDGNELMKYIILIQDLKEQRLDIVKYLNSKEVIKTSFFINIIYTII